jgi:hypothetical protein
MDKPYKKQRKTFNIFLGLVIIVFMFLSAKTVHSLGVEIVRALMLTCFTPILALMMGFFYGYDTCNDVSLILPLDADPELKEDLKKYNETGEVSDKLIAMVRKAEFLKEYFKL